MIFIQLTKIPKKYLGLDNLQGIIKVMISLNDVKKGGWGS